MTTSWLEAMQRGWRKPPSVIATRAWQEVRKQFDRAPLPRRTGSITPQRLLRQFHARSIDELWNRCAARPFPAHFAPDRHLLERLAPGSVERLLEDAQNAIEHRVDLLGTGHVTLGPRIDWHRDCKTGHTWPCDYFARIDCLMLDDPCDVKVPWEISRLQWLIPAGQAYLLTRDETYALAVRNLLDDWIVANPCLYGVNWACTMEAAMRTFVWCWLFHTFHPAVAWQDPEFRQRFLTALYSHGEFTDGYLEWSDVNTNHCTADAAALVFAGLFFGGNGPPRRWRRRGWRILQRELFLQTTQDGVDFEGSVPYHRLVTELFLWPALYRQKTGRNVSADYQTRLAAMARFASAYTPPHGGAPQWGDGDDARVLPFSQRSGYDHRYLNAVVSFVFGGNQPLETPDAPLEEVYWILGPSAAEQLLTPPDGPKLPLRSRAFPDGGYYILRNDRDHVFIDCAPVGQAGRGGHGHNDCLSFEATLDGVRLIVDPGCYVYSASYQERNRFRSTAAHNTPGVDGQEINRFLSPRNLWNLANDAHPCLHQLDFGEEFDVLVASHTGYERLADPVRVRRGWRLDHRHHRLEIHDEFLAARQHRFEIPLHLAPGVGVERASQSELRLTIDGRRFRVSWHDAIDWTLDITHTWIAPRYGHRVASQRLAWSRSGSPVPFRLTIEPLSPAQGDGAWAATCS